MHECNRTGTSLTATRYLKRIKYGNWTPHVCDEDLTVQDDWMFEYSRVPLQDGVQTEDAEPLCVQKLSADNLENLPIGLSGPFQFVDLDSEGLSGILTEQAFGWYYKPNLGNGDFGLMQAVAERPSFAALTSGQQ